MFIIYGWRGIPESIGQGTFACPTCGCQTGYEHQQIRTYITLFFIPIIPLAAGERFVLCRRCNMAFQEGVLLLPALETSETRYETGDRVLAKKFGYWYPATVRGVREDEYRVDLDNGDRETFTRSQITSLDLQEGDPIYVRCGDTPEYQQGTIATLNGDSLRVRFDDGRQEWTTLSKVRVIWDDAGDG